MKANTTTLSISVGLVAGFLLNSNAHANDSKFYLSADVGFSWLADTSANAESVLSESGVADVNAGGGFNAGAGMGYQFSERIAAELSWEYRSHDSEVDLPSGMNVEEGDFASNTFAVSGLYYLRPESSTWRPYIGMGLVRVEEVDIDLLVNGNEQSFSASGDTGFQAMAGLEYRLNDALSIDTEFRYMNVSGITLEAEEGSVGTFTDIDYQPLTLQIGLKYQFWAGFFEQALSAT